jgi:hypothetical protein
VAHRGKSHGRPLSFPPFRLDCLGIRRNKRRSKGEQACHEALEEIYGHEFYTCRPDFLKNPESGRNLELDCYSDTLKLAVVYNGVQHYKWPNFTNQSKEQFIDQIRRDKFKADMCELYGIYLLIVPYNVELCKIKEYIMYNLPENGDCRRPCA